MIVETNCPVPTNPAYSSVNAGSETTDKIYLLSIAEFNALSNSIRVTGSGSSWWLRSPGYDSGMAAVVDSEGSLDTIGDGVGNGERGVRPALTIKFE